MRRPSLLPRPTPVRLARRAALAHHGEPRAGGIELLVWIGGAGEQVLEQARATLGALATAGPWPPVALLFDRADWAEALRPLVAGLSPRRELVLPRPIGLPQVLYGRGIETSRADTWAFAWPGAAPTPAGLTALRTRGEETGAFLVHGDLPAGAPPEASPPAQHGWLRMADLVPMHHCLLSRRGWSAAGGFDPSPVLRRGFWWDFTWRLSRVAPLVWAPAPPPPRRWSWEELPLAGEDPAGRDLVARWVARGGSAQRELPLDLPAARADSLAAALDRWHAERGLRAQRGSGPARRRRGPGEAEPLQVTVVSHLLDAHQCDICFHSLFARVAGAGRLSWRTLTYEDCRDEDLERCDLLVMSRPRFPSVPAILDGAARRRLPVLVMIDDNWIAAGREYPRFAPLFTPGRPAFEVFLEALRRADATLVYNAVLEQDVSPHARRVVRLPPGIDVEAYAGPRATPARAPRRGLLVGYAGSPRWEGSAFQGLVRFLRATPTARLVLMAHEIPAELREVPAERLDFHPWQHDFGAYAAALGAAAPDVLLGPLEATRFSASKVPRKLLEAGAVGAAPLLSRVPPYTEAARDGVDALLVDNDPASWEAALHRLAGDPALRDRIAAGAAALVRERHANERVLPGFLAALEDVARGASRRARDGGEAAERQTPAAKPPPGSRAGDPGGHQPPRAGGPPRRVACISHSSLAGSERVLVRMLSALDRERFAPLAVLPEEGPLRAELEAAGVPVHVLPVAWWIPATHWPAEHYLGQLEGLRERAAALAALLRRERVEVVHTNTIVTLEGALAAAELGLPHVWHSRGLFGGGFPPRYHDDVGFFLGVVDRLSDAIVCVSREVERQTAEHCRLAARRVVYDGLDVAAFLARPVEPRAALLARYGIREGATVVACVGGLQRRKGQLDLVEAAALLHRDVPDLVVALAGAASEPEYAAAVLTRASELGLAGRVRHVGFEPNVRNLFAIASALVHPSHSEGFGLAIVEAMAAGLPVVATRCGGPEEIVEDGVSGLLVPVRDPPALAAALRRVLVAREGARALGEAAAARARRFDLRETGAAIGAVYDEALALATRAAAGDATRSRREHAAAIADDVLGRARLAVRRAGAPPAAPPPPPRNAPLGRWLARLRRRPPGSPA